LTAVGVLSSGIRGLILSRLEHDLARSSYAAGS
jgi:hypothetical protein